MNVGKLKRLDKYIVSWIDSCGEQGWKELGEVDKDETDMYQETVGFFLYETENSYCFCMTMALNSTVNDMRLQIPKVAILKIKRIKNGKNKTI